MAVQKFKISLKKIYNFIMFVQGSNITFKQKFWLLDISKQTNVIHKDEILFIMFKKILDKDAESIH